MSVTVTVTGDAILTATLFESNMEPYRREAYPLEGAPPPGEATGELLPDGAPFRKLVPVDAEEIRRNFEALNEKYEEERDRRLNKRPQQLDGQSNYVRLADLAGNDPRFQYMIDDPWIDEKWKNRAPVSDDIEVAIIGGGFGGLLSAGRLRQAGFAASDIRIVEKGGDVGGTWYW